MTNRDLKLYWKVAVSQSQTKYNGMNNQMFLAELF